MQVYTSMNTPPTQMYEVNEHVQKLNTSVIVREKAERERENTNEWFIELGRLPVSNG